VSPATDAVLARLSALHPKVIDLSLGRVERLLERLGHPERRLPPVVHVAGTNGKGSVVAYLRAMLEAGGRRVHVYTSPHLVRFHERIRLAGTLIGEGELLALLEECERANGTEPITFFEITTAAAFLAFARQPADVLLLEVGLGGRLDATNVVARPLASVITPVSMDHMQFLGDSLAAIAGEKAGILKPGVPAFVGLQEPAAQAVILDRAAAVGAPVTAAGRDFSVTLRGDGFSLAGVVSGDYPRPALRGTYQCDNAALAIATACGLGPLRPDDAAIRRGLSDAVWPARMQRLTRGPLVEALPADWQLWLDGGHNEAAGRMLAAELADWDDRPCYLVYGMLNTKAAEAFLAPLARGAAALRAVAIPGEPNSLSAEAAAQHARSAGIADAVPADSVAAAVAGLARRTGPARVLICGSLYLAGRVLAENG